MFKIYFTQTAELRYMSPMRVLKMTFDCECTATIYFSYTAITYSWPKRRKNEMQKRRIACFRLCALDSRHEPNHGSTKRSPRGKERRQPQQWEAENFTFNCCTLPRDE
ncbi:hypothetical protein TNCT_657001 [Trichonephila clavata]|uniref:Uncharacterized protein n=1 Tax=Trichonephila clavata TaxID=2740835 RepID=A0A8X6HJ74_TRICU|nr:hypothetical protein TNCT_657001 [Trichonephila clavata]